MKLLLVCLVLLLFGSSPAVGQSLNNYIWKSRLVLLFTPAPDDPMFERQVRLLTEQRDALEERDVILLFITPDGEVENSGRFLQKVDAHKLYEKFDAAEHQLEMVLVGLDGTEKFRARNQITPPSVLWELIDGMPMRRRELQQAHGKRNDKGGRR